MKVKEINFPRRAAKNRHLDDWLVTYADVITLLLCFFILFLSLTVRELKKEQTRLIEETKPKIEAHRVVAEMPAKELAPIEKALPPKIEKAEKPQPLVRPDKMADNTAYAVLPLSDVADIMAMLQKDDSKKTEDQGARLKIVEMNSATFFASGSAELSEEGKKVLKAVAQKIKSEAFKEYRVTVEGHTDDTPIHTDLFPSNWELSAARASAVVRFFLEEGIEAARLRAAGYADSFPKVPNEDARGNPLPENQAQNRRVVIKLEKIER